MLETQRSTPQRPILLDRGLNVYTFENAGGGVNKRTYSPVKVSEPDPLSGEQVINIKCPDDAIITIQVVDKMTSGGSFQMPGGQWEDVYPGKRAIRPIAKNLFVKFDGNTRRGVISQPPQQNS